MSGGEDQETWTGTRKGAGVSMRKRRRRLAGGVLATRVGKETSSSNSAPANE